MPTNHRHDPTPLERHHSLLAEELIEAVGGPRRASGYAPRVSEKSLSAYSRTNVQQFMPSDVIEALERRAGRPIFTLYLARMLGYLLVRAPDSGAGPWPRDLRELGKDSGDVMAAICDCLGDEQTPGVVTAREIEQHDLIALLDRLAEIVAEMRAQAVETLDGSR